MSKNKKFVEAVFQLESAKESVLSEQARVDEHARIVVGLFRLWREEEGLSYRECAEKLGISSPYLSDIEAGRRGLSSDVLAKMQELISVTK